MRSAHFCFFYRGPRLWVLSRDPWTPPLACCGCPRISHCAFVSMVCCGPGDSFPGVSCCVLHRRLRCPAILLVRAAKGISTHAHAQVSFRKVGTGASPAFEDPFWPAAISRSQERASSLLPNFCTHTKVMAAERDKNFKPRMEKLCSRIHDFRSAFLHIYAGPLAAKSVPL